MIQSLSYAGGRGGEVPVHVVHDRYMYEESATRPERTLSILSIQYGSKRTLDCTLVVYVF